MLLKGWDLRRQKRYQRFKQHIRFPNEFAGKNTHVGIYEKSRPNSQIEQICMNLAVSEGLYRAFSPCKREIRVYVKEIF